MPAITPFAKLIVVLILTVLDIINYLWGIEIMGLRNEQAIGIIVTLLLAGAAMIGLPTPQSQHPPA